MAVDNTALNQEEIDFLAQATLSRRVANRGDVDALDRVESGLFKFALARAKSFGPPVQGGFRFFVKGNRGQKVQWWQGDDILTFANKQTMSDMVFDVGMGHYGWELLYDTIKRNGIPVDFNAKGLPGGKSPAVLERVANIIDETLDDVEYDWMDDLRRRFMRSNADQPRCFTGRDGLIGTANTTGTIGKRSRTNKMFQHFVSTSCTVDTIGKEVWSMWRNIERYGGKIELMSCGDAVYDLMYNLMCHTAANASGGPGMTGSTFGGKVDFARANEFAMKQGEKYNIALPQNCFAYQGKIIMNDPIYALLHEEYPTEAWNKRMDLWDFRHFGIVPVIDKQTIQHPMPYNQRLSRSSLHGEWAVWCNKPRTQGVITVA
jgi:hypothetical protein